MRENDYSPAGKEIIPNRIVIHKSNPMFRNKIMENGLKVRTGECYKIYVGYGVKCKPAIFATNSTNKRAWFDSTYDDDIWEINTEMIPSVKWYKDRHFESRQKHIVTFQDIPKEVLTLKYEGTGGGDVETWDKDSPNIVRESIRRILQEETKLIPLILRRVRYEDLEREFEEVLDISSNKVLSLMYGDFVSLDRFRNLTVSRLIAGIYYELYRATGNTYELHSTTENPEWYDKVFNNLSDYYNDRIEVRYKELMSEM